ncbi:MAG: hypothetical protein ACI9R3_005536, partial [Verrucomicrobiales bacterium]
SRGAGRGEGDFDPDEPELTCARHGALT